VNFATIPEGSAARCKVSARNRERSRHLVGPSGAGKSTDYRADRGRFRAFGRACSGRRSGSSTVKLNSYRTQLGVVLQKFSFRWNDPKMWLLPAQRTEQEILAVCHIARSTNSRNLSRTSTTRSWCERGVKLSGARSSVFRSLAPSWTDSTHLDPDEATSSWTRNLEALIQEGHAI